MALAGIRSTDRSVLSEFVPPEAFSEKREVIDEIFSLVLENEAKPVEDFLHHLKVVDLNIRCEGWTPLHIAACKGNVAMVAILLDHGARINSVTEHTQLTALHIAAIWGHRDVVDLLLARSAKRSIKSCDGRTASQLAKGNCLTDIARQIKNYKKTSRL